MKHEITRSAGTPTGYGSYIVGGGYSGATKELDDTVQGQARLLAETFGRDVEIRFNSNRQSGGAWLKDDLPGFAGNTQVGFNAELLPKPPKGKTRHQWYKELSDRHGWGREMDGIVGNSPREVVIFTNIKSNVAKDPRILNSGPADSRYAYTEHKSLKEGIGFIKKHVDIQALNPYKGQHASRRVSRTRRTAGKRKATAPSALRGVRR